MIGALKQAYVYTAALVLVSSMAFAGEVKILETTNDSGEIPNSDMFIVTDDQGIAQQLKVVYKNNKGQEIDEVVSSLEEKSIELMGDSEKEEDRVFGVDDLVNGAVIVRKSGQNVVILKSPDLDPSVGGSIILDYLDNGMTRKRKTRGFKVQRNGMNWEVFDGAKKITKVNFFGRTFLGQVIGISSITVE